MRLERTTSTHEAAADFGLLARTAVTPNAHNPASPGEAELLPGLFLIVAVWVDHIRLASLSRFAAKVDSSHHTTHPSNLVIRPFVGYTMPGGA